MPPQTFTQDLIEIIRSIPPGNVATYGGIAALAGNPRAARQVSRVLHACSEKENLPWWRVVNRAGKISLKPGSGYEEQKAFLAAEGIALDAAERIDLARFLWKPDWME